MKEKNLEIAKMLGYKFENHSHTWRKKSEIYTELNFDLDWNLLMEAIEFIDSIVNKNTKNFDVICTMNYLLNGQGLNSWLPKIKFSKQNLFERVFEYAKYHNQNAKTTSKV